MRPAEDPVSQDAQPRFAYNAFLSYSHVADRKLALAVQQALHRFAKSPFRLRAARVFCDRASLGANPALWSAIEQALTTSEFLILMASPAAAASPWVAKEVDCWLTKKPSSKVLIALTGGDIAWNEGARDFDWSRTTALPVRFSHAFDGEPLWVDFRWAQEAGTGLQAHPRFRDGIADLAATLHGRPKDELVGEDVRQARRIRRLSLGAIALLATLALAFGWMFVVAERRGRVAAAERDRALTSQSHYLADAALRQLAEGNPETAVLLALEALPGENRRRPYVAQAEAALHTALGTLGIKPLATLTDQRPPVSAAAFSPDGQRLVTVDGSPTPRVWDVATGKVVLELKGHDAPAWFAEYLPDGTGIITAAVDQTARLWNARTGEPLRIFRGHKGPLLHAAIGNDGRLLATASGDSTARLWRMDDGLATAVLRGHTQAICCIQMSPDGKRVATEAGDGTARLWDADTGRQIAVFKGTPMAYATPAGSAAVVRFSAASDVLATAHTDHSVRLWKASDGQPITVLAGHSAKINDAAFSSDGQYFATASDDGVARLFKLDTLEYNSGEPIHPAVELRRREAWSRSRAFKSVAFGPEGDFLLTGSEDSIQLWATATGDVLASAKIDTPAERIVMSPDGRRIATLHITEVNVWQIAGSILTRWRRREESETVGRAERGPVVKVMAAAPHFSWTDNISWQPSVAIARDGKTAAAVTGRSVALLDMATGRVIVRFAAHSMVVTKAVFNPAADVLLTASRDGSAKLWDARTGALRATLAGHEKPIVDAAFGPAGEWIATASEDGTLRLWGPEGAPKSVLRGHTAALRRLVSSGDGARMMTASDDGTARIWDVAAQKELAVFRSDKAGFGSIALDRAGDRALTAGLETDYTVTLWDVATARTLHRWDEYAGTVTGVVFTADNRAALTWGVDGLVRMWDAAAPYGSLTRAGHGCLGPGAIEQAWLAGGGDRIVTVIRSGRADVWDRASGASLFTLHTFAQTRGTAPCYTTMFPQPPEIVSAAAAPGLRSVLLDGSDGSLALFELPTSEEIIQRARQVVPRTLTPLERRRFFLTDWER